MIATARQLEYRPVKLYGAPADLMRLIQNGDAPDEILIEGPAGTGKSFGVTTIIVWLCETYSGIRVLIARKTLTSMRDTILKTLEESFPKGHLAIARSRRHDQRPHYQFPNGSEIITASFENAEAAEKIKSLDVDVFFANESTDLAENDFEIAITRLRNGKLPLGQFAIIDANPVSPLHWVNRRPEKQRMFDGRKQFDEHGRPVPQMVRLRSRHEDNPTLVNPDTGEYTKHGRNYLSKLDSLTGHRYARLRLGQWVQAEGVIWSNFDDRIHVIDELPKLKNPDGSDKLIKILWHFASVDWGYRAAGVMQVWGVDADRRMYLVREIYMSEKNPDWWADKAVAIQKEFDPRVFVCDPSQPGSIDLFNHRLYQRDGRNCAIPANNEVLAGLNMVRDRLTVRPDGTAGMYFFRNALEQIDASLIEAKKPTCTVQEIPDYCFRPDKEGQRTSEEPEKDADDHGADGARYAAAWLDYSIFEPTEEPEKVIPGSFADVFQLDDFLARCRAGEFQK